MTDIYLTISLYTHTTGMTHLRIITARPTDFTPIANVQ